MRLFGLIILLYLQICSGLRILGIFPHPGKSHHVVFDVLLRGLAAKGHEVTVISYFPYDQPPKNWRDISLKGSLDVMETIFKIEDFTFNPLTEKIMRPYVTSNLLTQLGGMTCKAFLENKQVHQFNRGDFDLVIIEQFSTDCGLGLVHKLQVPFVGIVSHVLMPYSVERFGLIENPAYVASHQSSFPTHGNFLQNIEQVLVNAYYKFQFRHQSQASDHAMMKKYYGDDLPELETIAKNASLVLASTHFTVNGAHPRPPSYIEIGGMYLEGKKPKKLPQDLQKYLDESNDGFVLFCMGSMIKATSWPEDTLAAFKEAFAELPQRVIWKWDDDKMEGLSDNVRVMKWIPQFDILGHKNIKAFITHGGMLGSVESIHFGIPVIVMPLYSDQPHNGARATEKGMGFILEVNNVTKSSLKWALKEIMEPKYKAAAKKLSAEFRDRPMTSLDTAIYWVEYAARHGGEALRSPARDLPIWRYLMLDSLAVVIFAAVILLYIEYRLIKCCFSSKKKPQQKKNKRD